MKNPQEKPFQPRTARKPDATAITQHYVIAEGAPKHYVSGYGLVGPGAIVTLAEGVKPGQHLVEVSPEQAAKAGSDEAFRAELATNARAKVGPPKPATIFAKERAKQEADAKADAGKKADGK